MIGRMFTYFVFVSVFAALLLGVNMQMLLQMLTPPEFWPAAYIARIEIVSLIVLGWYHHVVFGLFHTKRTHTMSLIRGVTSGVKIGISFIFIRTWGLAGAAYSALVASVVQTVWGWYAGQRVYRIDFQYSKVLVLVAAAVGIDLVVEWLQLADSTLVNVLHDAVVGPSFHWLHSTWLGAGEHSIIARLDARTRALTVLAVQTCFCSTYVLLLPFVRRPAR
jgi:O-antigen/teichoic acid export membrane protein